MESISLIAFMVTYIIRYFWVHGTTKGFQEKQCQDVDSSQQQLLLSEECNDGRKPAQEQQLPSPAKEQTQDQHLLASTIEDVSPSPRIEEELQDNKLSHSTRIGEEPQDMLSPSPRMKEEEPKEHLSPSPRVEEERSNQLSLSPCIVEEEEPKDTAPLFVRTAEEPKDKLQLSAQIEEEANDKLPHSDDDIAEEEPKDKLSVFTCIAEGGGKDKLPRPICIAEVPKDNARVVEESRDGRRSILPRNPRDEEKEEGELIEEKDDVSVQDLSEDQELQHPAAIYISNAQLATEKTIAAAVEVVHKSSNNQSFPLQVVGTTFNLSSFHFATNNNSSATLYNNLSIPRKSRLEYIDFTRPQLHLYMWDRRHAVALSLQSPQTNRYQTRFFLAMTNLCMPLDAKGKSVFEELVLLDILYRLDPYAYIDAVVGVVATGEVILWKYSINHLRFNYSDFKTPLKRGEAYWFARLEQFYESKGLLYVRQRLIPRDIDAPRHRFAVNKEYITHYKQPCKSLAKVDENFKKWLVVPGKNRSSAEQSEDLQELLDRSNKGSMSCANLPAEGEKTKAQIEQEEAQRRQQAGQEKRKATIKRKAAEAAAAAKATTAAASAAAVPPATAAAAELHRPQAQAIPLSEARKTGNFSTITSTQVHLPPHHNKV